MGSLRRSGSLKRLEKPKPFVWLEDCQRFFPMEIAVAQPRGSATLPPSNDRLETIDVCKGQENPSLEKPCMIRNLILLAIVAGGLVVAGVIQIQQNGTSVQVTVDKQKLKATAREVIQEGEQIIKNAAAQSAAQTKTR